MERNHEVAAVEGSLMQVAYQEANDLVTFSNKDLVNQVVDGNRPLYVIAFLGAYQIKRALIDTASYSDNKTEDYGTLYFHRVQGG